MSTPNSDRLLKTAVCSCQGAEDLVKAMEEAKDNKGKIADGRAGHIIPIVTLYALGLETGIKAMLVREGKQPSKTHDLLELYEALQVDTRKGIRTEARKHGIRAQGLLMEHRNSLTEWRYREDTGALPVDIAALDTVLRIVVEMYNSRYGKELTKQNDTESATPPPQGMLDRAQEYHDNVRTN